MNWLKPVYKKIAPSEIGAGHTSGIVPTKNTQDYFGVPSQDTTQLISKIFLELWDNDRSKIIAVNVNYFKSTTHNHIHLTGNLLPAYKSAGAEVGDVLVFWKSSLDPLSFQVELIKKNSKRWNEAGEFAFDAPGGDVNLNPPHLEAGDMDTAYEIPAEVEEKITSDDFPTVERQGRQRQGERFVTIRNKAKGDYVLKQQKYKCQVDSTHESFVTKAGLPYMEKHHLISMMYYEEYTNDLDDIGNIVSLCPNCHRKIHLGNKNDVKDMLEVLYEQQKVKLEKAGLPISLDLLKEKYGVI
jgi:5-methylcytosine-specific restriction protein A